MDKYCNRWTDLLHRATQGQALTLEEWDTRSPYDNQWTMAHEVAGNGKVPTNFNSWEWQAAGLTVAHILVKKAKYLPHSFDQWGLISTDGFSVAHTAILFDNLPISFNQWAIEDSHGSALKSAVCRPIMKRCLLDLWATEKPLCKTEKDWTVFKAELPEVYVRYSVQAIIEDMEGSQSKQQLM